MGEENAKTWVRIRRILNQFHINWMAATSLEKFRFGKKNMVWIG